MAMMASMVINPTALREFRRIRDRSCSEVARAVGVKQPHLSNIELGKRGASADLIERLADELDVELAALLAVPEGTVRAEQREARRKAQLSARKGKAA